MKRGFARVLAACVALLVLCVPCASANDDPVLETYPFRYFSPVSALEYDYDTAGGSPRGTVTAFRVNTSFGALSGRITDSYSMGRIELTHDETGQRSVLTHTPSSVEDFSYVHLWFPDTDTHVYYKFDDRDPASPTIVADSGADCPSLSSSPLFRASREAVELLAQDFDLAPHKPHHLIQVSSAVVFSQALVYLVEGCEGFDDPEAGRCHFDDTFSGCSACCEEEAAIFALICMLGKTLCPFSWCGSIGFICGGVQNVMADTCVEVQCNGKTGDPDCPPEQQCGTVAGSTCWAVCGITQKSVCGKCPPNQECCAPI